MKWWALPTLPSIQMAFDGFIKIKGIDGESSDIKHQGWIEISDCNMEILQTISTTASSAGGASAERADFSDFCFTKLLDKASPQLAQACAKGTHFETVTLELCRAGSEKIKFIGPHRRRSLWPKPSQLRTEIP
jgi:type VI secretion system secreted protein Hcp